MYSGSPLYENGDTFSSNDRFLLSSTFLILQPENLPQQPNLPKRSLASEQSRSGLIPIARLLNLLTQLLIRIRQPFQSGVVYPVIERLDGEPSEAWRVYDSDVREPDGESVQGRLESFRFCRGDSGHGFLRELDIL
jgi:hypothetical protein